MRAIRGRRGRLVGATVLALVAATACGNDGDGDPDASPSAGASAPVALAGTVNDHGTKDASGGSAEVEVELDDFYFGPTFVRGAPSKAYTLKLKNAGDVVHTFTVDGFPVDVTVQPGATADATISLPGSGAVRFYCRFHAGQGMQGAFYLNPGDTVTNSGTSGGGTTSSAPAGDGDGAYNQ